MASVFARPLISGELCVWMGWGCTVPFPINDSIDEYHCVGALTQVSTGGRGLGAEYPP